MAMTVISFIVPMYNSASYLEKNLKSIAQMVGQKRAEAEVLLVDDGSTDETRAIAYRYAKKYSFIQVIEAFHQGVSVARNLGVANATGKYLTFIDSDDEFAPNFVDVFETLIVKEPDLVFVDLETVDKDTLLENIDAKQKISLFKLINRGRGNTGIGLASIGASLGYQVILTMPETMSIERRNLLKAYGAKVVLTPGNLGMSGAIAKAKELAKEIPNAFIPSQFENTVNPNTHYLTTGPEIYQQLEGKIDIFVAGVGTGGTISGVGKYLKEKNPEIEIIAIEPEGSPVLSKGISGPHMIQGIGAGFVPNTLNTDIYDQIITVSNESAFETSREVAKLEGTLVGISSGAALYGATLLAKQEKNKGKNIVVLLPDTGERYLSTPLVLQD